MLVCLLPKMSFEHLKRLSEEFSKLLGCLCVAVRAGDNINGNGIAPEVETLNACEEGSRLNFSLCLNEVKVKRRRQGVKVSVWK